MKKSVVLFGSALVLVLASGAAAPQATSPAKHPIDQWLADCLAQDPSTQGQLQCLGEAYTRWDAELNRAYKALMAKLSPEEQAVLKESQRAWLKQRDEMFKLIQMIYAKKDGTMFRTMHAADRVDVVQKRALELSSTLDVIDLE